MLQWLGELILTVPIPLLDYETKALSQFAVFSALALFFFFSRRCNARLEPALPAPRPLARLAQRLELTEKPIKPVIRIIKTIKTPKTMTARQRENDRQKRIKAARKGKSYRQKQKKDIDYLAYIPLLVWKAKQGLAWLLRKTEWLVYDKFKLLPDGRTGQRLNIVVLLYISWFIANSPLLFGANEKGSNETLDQFIYNRDASELLDTRLQFAMWRLFVVVLLVLAAYLLPLLVVRKNREFYLDLTTVFFMLMFASNKLTICWPAGCCFGVPCAWGVPNRYLETTVFPVQLLEVALIVLGTGLCCIYILFGKTYRPGRGVSFSLLAFMSQRFFVEFLRYSGPEYRLAETRKLLGINGPQLVCLAGAVMAVLWLFILPLEKKLVDRLHNAVAALAARCFRKLRKKHST